MNNSVVRADTAASARTHSFDDAEFHAIARRVHQDFGLNLPINKKDMVYSRLSRRLKVLGLQDFAGYVQLLHGPGGTDELRHLRSSLTTNVTRFFREDHHFAVLREKVLPELIALARAGGRVRLWSAGCSAGQEPYSLALTLLDICPEAPTLDILILATDIDPVIIATAKTGQYPIDEMQTIPSAMQSQLVDCSATAEGQFAIGRSARALIRFAEMNLIDTWPMRGPMDVIFCRNVMIYFDPETQANLWSRFNDTLKVGGYLFIGHSERVSGDATQRFRRAGNNVYCKSTGSQNPSDHAMHEDIPT